jgi:hypothetical protein
VPYIIKKRKICNMPPLCHTVWKIWWRWTVEISYEQLIQTTLTVFIWLNYSSQPIPHYTLAFQRTTFAIPSTIHSTVDSSVVPCF